MTCLTLSTRKLSAELHRGPEEFCKDILLYSCIDVTSAFKCIYEFHVNSLNSMYYSNWFVMSYVLFLARFTECSVKCTHHIRVTFKRNISTSSKKIRYSHKIRIGHLQCKYSHISHQLKGAHLSLLSAAIGWFCKWAGPSKPLNQWYSLLVCVDAVGVFLSVLNVFSNIVLRMTVTSFCF